MKCLPPSLPVGTRAVPQGREVQVPWDVRLFPGVRNLTEDPVKVSAVLNWTASNYQKQLQRFLGFANFYRHLLETTALWQDLGVCSTCALQRFWWPSLYDAHSQCAPAANTSPLARPWWASSASTCS